jgi:hypothetical protein
MMVGLQAQAERFGTDVRDWATKLIFQVIYIKFG